MKPNLIHTLLVSLGLCPVGTAVMVANEHGGDMAKIAKDLNNPVASAPATTSINPPGSGLGASLHRHLRHP